MAEASPRLLALLTFLALMLAGCSGGGGGDDAGDDGGDTGGDDGGDGGDTGGDDDTEFDAAAACQAGNAPDLAVGDFWDTTVDIEGAGSTTSAESHLEVTAIGEAVIIEGTSETSGVEGEVTNRLCPGSLAAIEMETQGTYGGVTFTTTTTYDPPCNGFRFPMAVGDDYTYTCHATVEGTGATEYDLQMRVQVEATEQVTVEAGTFDAYRLKLTSTQDGGSPTEQAAWYADAACTLVKVTGENPDGAGSYAMELTDFACASA